MSASVAVRSALPGPAHDVRTAQRLGSRRKRANLIVSGLCVAATAIGLFMLVTILATLLYLGFTGLSARVFTESAHAAPETSGLLNAIVGTLIQTALGTAIGTPIGLLVGTYLSEYVRGSMLGGAVRFVSDVLLSAPSILIGLFINTVLVKPFHGFSALAGAAALAMLVIPIVVRTTEDMLRLIPTSLREAAAALGAPKWKVVTKVCYAAAADGILTGVLLAVARIAGETAPLLFTSFGDDSWSLSLLRPMSSLPTAVYKFANTGDPDWVALAWTGALLITAGVLAANIFARLVLRGRR